MRHHLTNYSFLLERVVKLADFGVSKRLKDMNEKESKETVSCVGSPYWSTVAARGIMNVVAYFDRHRFCQ